jgi:mRNA interferase MazF
MNSSTSLRRGQIYWIDFAPATGHEMTGIHPGLIVQNDVGNQFSDLTIVAALTSNLRAGNLPVGVFVPAGTAGLTKDSVIHCGHLYTMDKQRLGRQLGQLTGASLSKVDVALACSLGLP